LGEAKPPFENKSLFTRTLFLSFFYNLVHTRAEYFLLLNQMYGLQSGKNKKWIKWKWVAGFGGGGK
jgi:hypothetical protein